METIRTEHPWLAGDEANVLLFAGEEAAWWTFAGGRANAALAHELATRLDAKVTSDNFAVRFPPGMGGDAIAAGLDGLRGAEVVSLVAPAGEQAIDGLKFSECLPGDLAARVVRSRLADARGITGVLGQGTRIVVSESYRRSRVGEGDGAIVEDRVILGG